MSSLSEKFEKIRSPRLQNQRDTAVVLNAVEDTLREQKCDFTPTAYFAALLAILGQAVSAENGIINRDLATSVVYLLDLTTSEVPAALLRSKFSQILSSIRAGLTQDGTEASLVKSSIGCLQSLLVAQDAAAWTLPQTQTGPRGAIAGLLVFALDPRPKVRKRSQEAITHVLQNPPPSPSMDHPAADLCAESALANLSNAIKMRSTKVKRDKGRNIGDQYTSDVMHTLQLVKTVALASRGWPSKKIEVLSEILMDVSRSSNEYLTMTAFEIFELVFASMTDTTSSKLPRLLEAIQDLRPVQNDAQLVPPWIAVISRGYDVSAQIEPQDTFRKLPDLIQMVSTFLTSPAHSIRVSASECLISFLATCIPKSVILEPSIFDEKVFQQVSDKVADLLTIKYQAAWMEVFTVVSALFDALRWRAIGVTDKIIKSIGELRGNESFAGKKEADAVLGVAISAVGPEALLKLLPLNLDRPTTRNAGRAWLLPLLRDNITNTKLNHFQSEFVPLSETMYQKVLDHGDKSKTMETKIFETLVQQIWALLPGYCHLPLDLHDAFDQSFAELLANVLYKQTDLRVNICKALQNLIESNQVVISSNLPDQDLLFEHRISKATAKKNLDYLASFAGNLLAVLFNIYGQTLPHHRGYILQCISAHLSIIPTEELQDTFSRAIDMLESSLPSPDSAPDAKAKPSTPSSNTMPPESHTLLDLLVTLSPYLPSSSFSRLFQLAARVLPLSFDPQLQKKAYKLLPKIAASEAGSAALKARSPELQSLLLDTAVSVTPPCRHDRLNALAAVIQYLPPSDLHFIPSVLSEVVVATKETNEKARLAAFDTLVLMAERMDQQDPAGQVIQSKIPHMPATAPTTPASLQEFFTMLAAGLGGDTPHMVSASITALTRVLYSFHAKLPTTILEELLGAMMIFLENPNREIVRSVLGFMKVAIISLPEEVVRPNLEAIVKGLMKWSKEHKSHFRVKVKGILERAMRRFGAEEIEKVCPEQDRSLVKNIRKARERNKRKKKEGTTTSREDLADDGESDRGETAQRGKSTNQKGKYASAFDNEVYGSEDSDASSEASSEPEAPSRSRINQSRKSLHQQQRQGKTRSTAEGKPSSANTKRSPGTYIHEDPASDGDPLDLLSTSALGHIRPSSLHSQEAPRKKHKGKINIDGKLVIGMDNDTDNDKEDHTHSSSSRAPKNPDAMLIDDHNSNTTANKSGGGDRDKNMLGGIDAYVEAIKGRDAVQRGRGGKLKFGGNKRVGKWDVDAMDLDDDNDNGNSNSKTAAKEAKGRESKKGKPREGDRVNGLKIHYVGGAKKIQGGRRGGGGGGAGGKGGVRGGRVGKSRASGYSSGGGGRGRR